jgi:mediator of RNA polymerase II transcription subunit 17
VLRVHPLFRPEDPSKVLGSKLHQIIAERGLDFFEKTEKNLLPLPPLKADTVGEPSGNPAENAVNDDERPKLMTTEEVFKMRMEIAPQLFIAMGEMNQARELLSALLSTRPSASGSSLNPLQSLENTTQNEAASLINATTVTKPPGIPSVDAFNAQLTLGTKDEALRKAANTFRLAAESMERGCLKSEKYWTDALKVRRMNWSLVPAPLAFGAPTGKGADKTSKDFLVSFGLEEFSGAKLWPTWRTKMGRKWT